MKSNDVCRLFWSSSIIRDPTCHQHEATPQRQAPNFCPQVDDKILGRKQWILVHFDAETAWP
jgi:hypothetical protein